MINKTLIVYDRGNYTYLAQTLAKYFSKVQYCIPSSEAFIKSPRSQTGKGLPGVEWIDNLFKYVDKSDIIFFPDVYDGDLQVYLKSKGHKVVGSGKAEIMELSKLFFKDRLKQVGLPVSPYHVVKGIDGVRDFLRGKTARYVLKNAEKYRGDFETFTHKNKWQTDIQLNDIEHDLGIERSKEIQIIIENWLEAECEVGCDGFMLNGIMPRNSILGYEIKDEGYIGKVFYELPFVTNESNLKLEPIYRKLGYNGPYSNEMRITKDGKVYRTDETNRCGSPPTPSITELYGESYAKGIESLSDNNLPVIKPVKKFSAEIVLTSEWNDKHELYIGCPKNFEKYLKLHYSVMKNGQYYCLPDHGGGFFGSIVGTGSTIKEAITEAMNAIQEIEVYGMKYKENLFDECKEVIDNGKKFGIIF
jgi:hypothetical protein